jgi:GAF domain-containing protein
MTPDPQTKYRLLAHLIRVASSAADVWTFFQQAAAVVREWTDCDRVSLVLAGDRPAACRGLVTEFTGTPHCFETDPQTVRTSAAKWVLEHCQPRPLSRHDCPDCFTEERQLFDQGYQACVYTPLLCRGEAVGVLGLASRREGPPGQGDRQALDDLAGVLALALDDLAARTRVEELRRFQQETAYLRDEIKTDRALRLLTGES